MIRCSLAARIGGVVIAVPLMLASPLATARAADVPGADEPRSPAEWYGAGVRPSEARTPEEELAGFHVAPGFEVRLFAAEPEIAKPMNLAMDGRGRLWVTDSVEYPYAVGIDETGRDTVRVLEDTDGDGRADKSTVFADGLNIPIGVLPYGDGCICYSIPNLYYLRDTDGDGVCDRREKILGPFDTTRDTHGMINSIRMGMDGWVYANHGFNNQSTVAGADGHSITMISGNTFRFRPDGSRVEHVTWGQVNPFGRARDEWGYDYTADCHSKPISQLVSGGYYPSFGRPHDGLGFVPPMMDHLHGSTAISGLVYVPPSMQIPSLEHQMLSGNVMTSRINRNRVRFEGATALAEELPDFLTSDDPWFRPVDLRIGSDGFLYVADFYNRIIGHYEVPLEHPGRDRHRGRIWQIRPVGAAPVETDLTRVDSLVEVFNDGNPTRRRLALEEALRRDDAKLDVLAQEMATSGATAEGRVTALWYLFRRGLIERPVLESLASDDSPIVRTHLQRVLRALADTASPLDHSAVLPTLASKGLTDDSAHVRRAAAEALAAMGDTDAVKDLLAILATTDAADTLGRQTMRIGVRDLLQQDGGYWIGEYAPSLPPDQRQELASIALGLQSPASGAFLLGYLEQHPASDPLSVEMLLHAARSVAADEMQRVVDAARAMAAAGADDEQQMITRVAAEVGDEKARSEAMREWAQRLVRRDLEAVRVHAHQGRPAGVQWRDAEGREWPSQIRPTLDGRPVSVTSSFPLGEQYTGTLVSDAFRAPKTITFSIAGHNALPSTEDPQRNRLELIDAATERVLYRTLPPRRDQVERVTWDCSAFEGESVRIRCVDEDATDAYAWIAFGDMRPEWLNPGRNDLPLENALRTIEQFRLSVFADDLRELLESDGLEMPQRARIGQSLALLADRPVLRVLFEQLGEGNAGTEVPQEWMAALRESAEPLDEAQALESIAARLSTTAQSRLAERLAANRATLGLLLGAIDTGALAPEVLLEKPVETRLEAVADEDQFATIARLKERAQPVDQAAQQAIAKILENVAADLGDGGRGHEVYRKHCAACHQLGGVGEVIGPQLDGVGGRGAVRLLEDIVTPDRNVDHAFRTTTIVTFDGRVLSGLVRSEDDTTVTMAGPDGKIFQVDVEEIDGRREGSTSLMPSDFHQTLTDQEMADLVEYLIESAR